VPHAGLYLLDPRVQLYWGDSASYLLTATRDAVPNERPPGYGLLLRGVLGPGGALAPVVRLQIALFVLACVGFAWILGEHLGASRRRVWVATLLAGSLPLHVVWTRYVLAETSTLVVLTLLVVASLAYLRSGGITAFLAVQGAGLAAAALRTAEVPVALTVPLLLPALRLVAALRRPASGKGTALRRRPGEGGARRAGIHLALSLALLAGLHGAYRAYYAREIQRFWGIAPQDAPPAYSYYDGFFLLGSVAPLVRAGDFPPEVDGNTVLAAVEPKLSDPTLRNDQVWDAHGLVAALSAEVQRVGDPDRLGLRANHIAARTAMNAVQRDPVAWLGLGPRTLGQFVEAEQRERFLAFDLQVGTELPEWFRGYLQRRHRLDPATLGGEPAPLQRAYLQQGAYLAGVGLCMLLLPLAPLQERGTRAAFLLVGGLFAWHDALAVFLAWGPIGRHFEPASWFLLLLLFGFRPRGRGVAA
jgi:hypothetical protein